MPVKKFTIGKLRDAFRLIDEGVQMIEDQDPISERFITVSRKVSDSLQMYRTIYNLYYNKRAGCPFVRSSVRPSGR